MVDKIYFAFIFYKIDYIYITDPNAQVKKIFQTFRFFCWVKPKLTSFLHHVLITKKIKGKGG